MIDLTTSVDVDVPAAEAWSVVADYAQDSRWRAGVTSMVPDPAGSVAVGTTTHEEMTFGGRTLRNDGLVTTVEPGRVFAWRTTDGADADGSRQVVPLGDGRCRVTLTLRVRPHGFERLLAPVYRRMLGKGLAADAGSLRALLERRTAVSA